MRLSSALPYDYYCAIGAPPLHTAALKKGRGQGTKVRIER